MKKTIALLLCFILLLLSYSACNQKPSESGTEESATQTEKETQAETQKDIEAEMKSFLKGKYVSILGDSISTYQGISNSPLKNTTLSDNVDYYRSDMIASHAYTYWGRFIQKYEMNLLVNNSSGGSRLLESGPLAGYKRVEELAANTGKLDGVTPDYIMLYMGTNDLLACIESGTPNFDNIDINAVPKTFSQAYIITVEKAIRLYPNAKIMCFTLLTPSWSHSGDTLFMYNNIIRKIAEHYKDNVILVDIARKAGITVQNMNNCYIDGLHPNVAGMRMITQVVEEAMKSSYENN